MAIMAGKKRTRHVTADPSEKPVKKQKLSSNEILTSKVNKSTKPKQHLQKENTNRKLKGQKVKNPSESHDGTSMKHKQGEKTSGQKVGERRDILKTKASCNDSLSKGTAKSAVTNDRSKGDGSVQQKVSDGVGKKTKRWKKWPKQKKKMQTNRKLNPDQISQNSSLIVKDSSSVKAGSAKITGDDRTGNRLPSPNTASSNWKELQKKIKKPKRSLQKTHKKKKDLTVTPKETQSGQPLDVWFDDVDEELINPVQDLSVSQKKTAKKTLSRLSEPAEKLVKQHAFKGVTRAVALDCEMVGVGDGGKESVLARVSVVNQYGECLYDTFVRSREEVVDYRTKWSGVTPEKLENAADFLDVQRQVSDLIRGRILVGHAVTNDLKVLFLDHPRSAIRDTSRYKPYKEMFKGRTPSLKNLTSRLLNVKIQTGQHSSVTDAQATMRLYTLSRVEWEKRRKSSKRKNAGSTGKSDSIPSVKTDSSIPHGKESKPRVGKKPLPVGKKESIPHGKKPSVQRGKDSVPHGKDSVHREKDSVRGKNSVHRRKNSFQREKKHFIVHKKQSSVHHG